jgi:hypothetical protein
MRRHKTPFLLGVLMVTIGLAFPQAGQAEQGQAEGAVAAAPDQPLTPIPDERSGLGAEDSAAAPNALQAPGQAPQEPSPQSPRLVLVPARPLAAYSVAAGAAYVAGPRRAYRRPPIAAYAGVYVAPRYVYPGHVAPWGSLPLSFYAASIPIPFRVVQPAGYLERSEGTAGRAYRPSDQTAAETNPRFVPESRPPSPDLPIISPPEPGPEAIPAPVPIDAPKPSTSSQPGAEPKEKEKEKGPTLAAEKPASRTTPSGTSGEGPREF